MKQLLETWVRRRNPHFSIHEAVPVGWLAGFAARTAGAMLRGTQLWLRGRASHGAMLGRGVSFQYLSGIRFGRWLKAGDQVRFSGLSTEGLTLGHSVSIGAFSQVIVSTSLQQPGAFIRIGHHVGIGEFAYLGGAGGLRIDDDCIIGQYFSCHPENHRYADLSTPIRQQGVTHRGIHIGPNCWIGSKVTVLDGVVLGEGCVVAAGAVVTRSFPARSVLGGVPARLLSSREPQPATPHIAELVL
ncbi:acyltransferase [Hymenobacter yonginensis]|uniref:Acyltransferase n=1 Tax=Hymenobacter yonginensis TaxID=748197 RepID=A0ABY7PRD1_9BACT|nr:acyltransferase [Hymenobacter yonginensis]WBO85408.1 acyltransferase [Hymenobacter yonginensis]